MKSSIFILFLFLSFFRPDADSVSFVYQSGASGLTPYKGDSLINQILYNGRVWRNLYIRIEGDPFFQSNKFFPGTVEINDKTFTDIPLRYDIYNDQIQILTDKDLILQLNKEMVNSFITTSGETTGKFIKIEKSEKYPVSGYLNLLYAGDPSLLVKYRKEVDMSLSNKVYGTFFQMHRIYLLKDSVMYVVGGRRSFIKLLEDRKHEIRNFIRTNKLSIARKYPESFVPVLEFYDKSR